MNIILIIQLSLISLCHLSGAQSDSVGAATTGAAVTGQSTAAGVIPIGDLSPDNPNHKHIIQWIDNYRQKTSQTQDYNLNRDQTQSKDSNQQQSYPALDESIKLLLNQARPSTVQLDEKSLPVYLDQITNINPGNDPTMGDLLPYAFQNNAPSTGANSLGQNLETLISAKQPENNHQDEPKERQYEQDIIISEHIKRYQEQNKDGRTVLVEVQGDENAPGQSMLDQIAPFIRDKSVLEQLRPHLHDSRSMITNQKNVIPERHSQTTGARHERPIYLQQKSSLLTVNKPLLQQREKLQELRQSLLEQQRLTPVPQALGLTQAAPVDGHRMSLGQFLTGNTDTGVKGLAYSPLPDPKQRQIILLEERPKSQAQSALLAHLEDMAIKPLHPTHQVNYQGDYQQNSPQLVQDIRQPLVFGAKVQTVEASRKPTEQKSGSQSNSALESYMNRNFGQKVGSEPRLTPSKQSTISLKPLPQSTGSQKPQLMQQHLSWTNWGNNGQIEARDITPESSEQSDGRVRRHQSSGQYELDVQSAQGGQQQNKKQLREQLLKQMEEQERKSRLLMDLDLKQRQMIADARRQQEVRDELDAQRLALEKQDKNLPISTSDKQQERRQTTPHSWDRPVSPAPPVWERPASTAQPVWDRPATTAQPIWNTRVSKAPADWDRPTSAAPDSRDVRSDQRWNSQELPQSIIIRNHMVDNDRVGPEGPVDVLHSIRAQPVEPINIQSMTAPVDRPTDKASDMRWSSMESPIIYNPQSGQQGENPRGIQISQAALAEAEKVDGDYIRRLREILMSHSQQSQPKIESISVPIEAPPTGAAQATNTGADGSNWWNSDRFQLARAHISRAITGMSAQ